jgi:hypothetical protein
MIRLISVAFALAVATSAQAMSSAPLNEPDAMITQVRQGRPLVAWPRAKCWDPNQRVINGICVFDAPPVPPRQAQVCCLVGRRLHRALWDAQGVAAGSLSPRQRASPGSRGDPHPRGVVHCGAVTSDNAISN